MGYLQKSTIPKPVVRNSQTNEKGKHGWHLHTLSLLTEGKKLNDPSPVRKEWNYSWYIKEKNNRKGKYETRYYSRRKYHRLGCAAQNEDNRGN